MKITLENVTVAFKEVIAVNNISLTIPEGELICLLGPSGCGKSTTLYALSGLQPINSGKIYFGDEDVTYLPSEKRGIGLVFQNYALYPHMTVEENILFPLENLRFPKNEAHKIMLEMAALCRIEDQLKKRPSQLSGGQQQRVAIARALAKKPRILFLDEPLSNLDARLRLEMREEIRRIQKATGVTTIFVTHDQEEAMSISDRLIVMKKGVIQQIDSPQHMYYHPINQFVATFLGNPPINIFTGEIVNQQLKIDDNLIIDKLAIADGNYNVGIRPEGFYISEHGFEVEVISVEYIGRDTLLSFKMNNKNVRALLELGENDKIGGRVKLAVKPNTLHIFDKNSEVTIGEK